MRRALRFLSTTTTTATKSVEERLAVLEKRIHITPKKRNWEDLYFAGSFSVALACAMYDNNITHPKWGLVGEALFVSAGPVTAPAFLMVKAVEQVGKHLFD